jgi:beta-galactosidase
VALNEGTSDVNAGIASPGVYWTAVKSTRESAHIQARVVLENQSDEAKTVDVVGLLYNRSGAVCLQQKKRCILEPRASGVRVDVKATLEQPRHWNGRIDPYLYDSTVEVRDHYNGQLLDVVHQRVGFRSFSFDPERGFILNGQPYPLYGVNAHQDERGKGWARSDQDLRRDVDLILEMGATIVRTAHYPANQAFYDRADETGLIVYTELAINGTTTGGTVPEGDPFLRAARDQMRELICQNYNHPSIVLWGLYNEINSNQNSQKVIRNLQELTKDQERLLGDLATNDEPLRKTTAATWSGFDDLASITDTIGFNRYYGWYKAVPVDVGLANDIDKLQQGHPTACIGIAEYGGGGSVHQHEAWDPERFLDAPNDKKNVLWHSETRQAWIHEQWWKSIAPRNYLCYSLIWQMFDSAAINRNEGDRPGINDKGLVTDDRKVKKDAFYFYKANWNDPLRSWANRPTLHIVDGRWRQRTSNQVLVRAYSNLETPRLALNGKQLGEMTPVGMHTYQMELTLVPGDNTVEITAQFGPLERRDRVIWSYYPSDLGSVTLQEQPACAIKTKTSPSASVKDNPLTPGDVPPQIQLHRRSAL